VTAGDIPVRLVRVLKIESKRKANQRIRIELVE